MNRRVSTSVPRPEVPMLALLFAACAPAPLPSYAGCTVTTVATDAEGVIDYERVAVYDGAGRMVSDRWDYGDGFQEAATTWEGDCLARQDVRHVDATATREHTVSITCDEHGHRTREEMRVIERSGGALETSVWGSTYDNEHDADGRLVRVRVDADDEGGPHQSLAYAWGACDDPVFSSFENDAGDEGHTTVACRDDGQPVESFTRWFDADGAPTMLRHTRHTYDALGRWRTRVTDAGDGAEPLLDYTATWGNRGDPGPAKVVLVRTVGEAVSTERWTSTYACDG